MAIFYRSKAFAGPFYENEKTLNEKMEPSTAPLSTKRKSGKTKVSKNEKTIQDNLLDCSDPFEADQFKTLRTRLLFPPSEKQIRSVGITSPSFGEGKTYICSKLGVFMAQNIDGKHAILLDADLRLARLHMAFGLGKETPGLSDYLMGQMPISEILQKPYNQNLLLLPGGRPTENPSELLSSEKMLDLISSLYTRYDDRYILVDLPSPNLVPEADVIARKMDGIIVVARAGKTPTDQVAQLVDRIGRERVVGVVLNRFDTSLHSTAFRMYRRFIRRK
jgi:capsular exopolysaccharide synthesis family protein